jgi:hypothetical protein
MTDPVRDLDPGRPVIRTHLLSDLDADHTAITELLAAVERTPLTGPARTALARDLTARILRHGVAEEEYLDPLVRHAVPDGLEMAAGSEADRAELAHLAQELAGLDGSHPRFDEVVGRLRAGFRRHVRAQQDVVFPRLRGSWLTARTAPRWP